MCRDLVNVYTILTRRITIIGDGGVASEPNYGCRVHLVLGWTRRAVRQGHCGVSVSYGESGIDAPWCTMVSGRSLKYKLRLP